jgi:putative LysE/RhtB family amino acid efflux pump
MIGVAIAAPVGPIGMLCIKKTLELGMRGAFLVGLGAALADAVYGLIGAFGLMALAHSIMAEGWAFKWAGGVFLLYLAYKEAKSDIVKNQVVVNAKNQFKLVGQVFLLTLANPMTILSFVGIFASIGVSSSSTFDLVTVVVGVFLGSMSWSCFLGAVINKIKHKLPTIWLERIKWFSCFILAGFGLAAIGSNFIN